MRSDTLSLGVIGSSATFAGTAAAALRALYPILGEPRYYSSGQSMIDALLAGEVDAIVGAHASAAGGFTPFGDILAKPDSKLYVIAEEGIPFRCCLLARSGSLLSDIAIVHCGPASIPMAQAYLQKNMLRARCELYSNSSGTVSRLIGGDGREAMLGTRSLADQYGLEILAENIDGDGISGNWWAISTQALLAPEPTLVVVSVRASDDGQLGRVVERLAAVGYMLSTAAARPTGAQLLAFDYLLRFRGAGRLADVRTALATIAGTRIAGALRQGPGRYS
jgi:prephenate dehydratase